MRDTPNNEAIIVEYGFVDSTKDDVNQLKNNWKNLTEAVVKAIAEYSGVPYKQSGNMENIDNNDYYTVKSGDTLWSISKKYNTTVSELKSFNNLSSNTLSIGQILKIPQTSTSSDTYVVKSGDTLYSIANKYNTTVSNLKLINNLNSNLLNINQVLKVPSNNTYTVKSGDTLYSIALDNNVSVDTIISDNVLPNNNLSVGQVLRLRVTDVEILECFGPDFEIPEEVVPSITYIVKAGDNLYSIARKYNTSVSAISNLNNLSSNNLSIGQQLLIPVSSDESNQSGSTYIVQKGDSLYSIARKFGTTVNDIIRLNNLSGTNLSIGQQLLIPGSNQVGSTNTYVVKAGDNLYSIARKFNTTVDNIKLKNNLKTNLLSIGQTLII